jgi:hydrogenase maturation protein HypF
VSAPTGPEARLLLEGHGVVQGVGARPALQRLADRLGLRGQIRNRLGVLQLDLCGPTTALTHLHAVLAESLPPAARLERLEARWLEAPDPPWPPGIVIAADRPRPLGKSLLAPGLSADRAPCPACLAELADPASRRHRYPFISCCACGPRYSLATALPFCRAHTTYAAFPPCPACASEFRDPADRRFHAETISCPLCGPRLALRGRAGQVVAEGEEALHEAARLLREGQILALQGVAGFQLLVDARQGEAVARLRRRKRRPSKPFALLVADPRALEGVVALSAAEEQALRHPAAPIVLLRRRFPDAAADPWELIAPGSPCLGVMLPASGLHQLLARALDRPLVATSGNCSGEPLCHTPEEAVERLAGLADAFLTHTLPIARPLDDSLLQVIDGRPALLRRARGFVPEPLPWRGPAVSSPRQRAVLAVGGDLKAAPGLVVGDQLWLAPHLGDLAEAAVQRRWQAILDSHLSPSAPLPVDRPALHLAADAHPGYGSHQWARALAERHGLSFTTVPHHLAHGLAVLAERGEQPPLLVVAWDGLGLADPASPTEGERLWGGELLWIEGLVAGRLRWRRLAALRPFPLPGGERASREPRRCALGLLAALDAAALNPVSLNTAALNHPGATAMQSAALNHPGAAATLQAFTAEERQLSLSAIRGGCNAPLTSSAGRLLDGVASLLGLAQVLSHEGEGGLRWQGAAARWAQRSGTAEGRRASPPSSPSPPASAPLPWRLPLRPSPPGDSLALPLGRWDWEPLLRALLAHAATGGSPEEAAWRVERALVRGIVGGAGAAARWTGCRRVALTGGCFQNRSLLEAALGGLRRGGLEPLWAERVPANDGGLAPGQAWAAQVISDHL